MKRPLTILDYFEATAARLPDKVYLQDEEESVTYGQCRDRAMAFGYALHRELAGARQKPVVLFMDKGYRCVTAMIGALYSGNFYVPMDVKTPIDRLSSILDTLGNGVMVTTKGELERLRKMGYEGDVLIYEDVITKWQDDGGAAEVLGTIRESIVDTDFMYILFTSGSTGAPKGVAVMHRSVVDYVEAFTDRVNVEEGDIHGSQTPLYTDMSLKDIYMAMKAGATVCLIPQRLFMSPKKLLEYLDSHGVTTLMWVPTAYRLVSQFDALEKVRPRALKKFLFSGEGMPVPVFRYWREHYPDGEYTQQYGPTEITGACTTFSITRDYGDGETIPIGRPFPNTGIILLDEDDRVVGPESVGVPGEICVYGTCLAAGYYNDPEKTAKAFVPNPTAKGCPSLIYRTGDLARYDENGDLVFISRKDYQVKHGGRRIELGDVETAFQAAAGMKAVCCVQDRRADKLVLYYTGDVPEDDMPLLARDKLPKYMIPAAYHRMDQLPTLSNGKLNRKLLDQQANE